MPNEFNCGDGWYSLVYNMCKEIKASNPPATFYITHIGERNGGLNVYTKNGVMRTRVIIDEFNTTSIEICDGCGNDRDLEMCNKCTIPVIECPDPEENADKTENECNTCSDNKCGCA